VPLPDASEAAAAAVAAIGDELDDAVLRHLATGAALPSVQSVVDRVADLVRDALAAAYAETWPALPRGLLRDTVQAIVDMLTPIITETLQLAALGRRNARRLAIPDDLVPEADTDGGLIALAKDWGPWAALGALFAVRKRQGRKARVERSTLAAMAAASG
jgi:hypothetical protein